MPSIVPFDALEHSEHSHEFVGAEHGDVPFCVILVHSQPGRRAEAPSPPIPRSVHR